MEFIPEVVVRVRKDLRFERYTYEEGDKYDRWIFFGRVAIFHPHNQIFFWKVMTQILKGMGIVPAKSGCQKRFNIGKIQR